MYNEAIKHLGKPYVLGTQGPDTFDCSGFIWWVLNQSGVMPAEQRAVMSAQMFAAVRDLPVLDVPVYWENLDPEVIRFLEQQVYFNRSDTPAKMIRITSTREKIRQDPALTVRRETGMMIPPENLPKTQGFLIHTACVTIITQTSQMTKRVIYTGMKRLHCFGKTEKLSWRFRSF